MPSDPRDAALTPDALAQAIARVEAIVEPLREVLSDNPDTSWLQPDHRLPDDLRLLLTLVADYVSREDRAQAQKHEATAVAMQLAGDWHSAAEFHAKSSRLLKLEPPT
jgi:hypothetical protein